MNPNPDPAPELPKTPRPEKNLEALTNQESPTAVPLLNDEVKLYKTDMEQDDQNIVLKAIVEAFSKFGEDKYIVEYIKEKIQREIGGKWSCILGRDFSSNVDHLGHYFYTFMDEIGILVFRSPN